MVFTTASIFVFLAVHCICRTHRLEDLVADRSPSEFDLIKDYEDINHGVHKVVKRSVIWSFHGNHPGPEFILPQCPCAKRNQLCLDFEYCYCKLGYIPPLSEVTGQPFLGLGGCLLLAENKSGLANFNSLSLLDKYLTAFPSLDWDCDGKDVISNQAQLIYPYLCVWKKMLPLKGTFYDTQRPSSLRTTPTEAMQYILNVNSRKYFWQMEDQKWRKHRPRFHKKNAKYVLRRITGFQNTSAPIKLKNGGSYDYSGGPGCFNTISLLRRGVSASYGCDIRFTPSDFSPGEINCDLIASIMDKEAHHFLNLQIRSILELDPNGTILFPSTPLKRVDRYKPKVTKRILPIEDGGAYQTQYSSNMCHNVTVGFAVKGIYRGIHLLETEIRKLTRNVEKEGLIYPIQLIFQSSTTDPKYFSHLSRFWYEFYHGECKEQFCWRDFLTFPLLQHHGSIEGDMEAFFTIVAIPGIGLVLAVFLSNKDLLDLDFF